MSDEELSASLSFRRGTARVGLERVRLLEAVAELGSISAAAKRLGLSYKGAWDVVQALNTLFDGDLIAAAPGGRSGGTTVITPRGEAVIVAFRRLETEIEATLSKLQRHLAADAADDPLLSLGMRTSARNVLRGTVSRIDQGAVSAEVAVATAGGLAVVSRLTRQSVEALGLIPGAPVAALIKANFVTLSAPGADTSADNRFAGRIVQREDGLSSSEITVEIDAGRRLTVTTPIEAASGWTVGDAVIAAVDAAQVILAVE